MQSSGCYRAEWCNEGQQAHLSALFIVSYNSEDAQVHEVGQEVEKKHSTCELLPLGLQQPVHGLHLEHLVASLTGNSCLSRGNRHLQRWLGSPCWHSQGCHYRTPGSPTPTCPRRSPERPGRTGRRWRDRKPTRWIYGRGVWWNSRGTPAWGCVKKAVDKISQREKRPLIVQWLTQQLHWKDFTSEILGDAKLNFKAFTVWP